MPDSPLGGLLGLSGREEQPLGDGVFRGMALGEGLYNFKAGPLACFSNVLCPRPPLRFLRRVQEGRTWLDLQRWHGAGCWSCAEGYWRKDVVAAVFSFMRERLRRPVWASWFLMTFSMMSATQSVVAICREWPPPPYFILNLRLQGRRDDNREQGPVRTEFGMDGAGDERELIGQCGLMKPGMGEVGRGF